MIVRRCIGHCDGAQLCGKMRGNRSATRSPAGERVAYSESQVVQNNPTMLPFSSMSIFVPAGMLGREGMVAISPHSA